MLVILFHFSNGTGRDEPRVWKGKEGRGTFYRAISKYCYIDNRQNPLQELMKKEIRTELLWAIASSILVLGPIFILNYPYFNIDTIIYTLDLGVSDYWLPIVLGRYAIIAIRSLTSRSYVKSFCLAFFICLSALTMVYELSRYTSEEMGSIFPRVSLANPYILKTSLKILVLLIISGWLLVRGIRLLKNVQHYKISPSSNASIL
jgi:hypothetical protein